MGQGQKAGKVHGFISSVGAFVITVGALAFGAWMMIGHPSPDEIVAAFDPPERTAQPRQYEPVEEFVPTDAEIGHAQREALQDFAGDEWTCSYDPTMDENWHNDILCGNGVTYHRPFLTEDDSFVTEDEARAAAATYEDYLNDGGTVLR